MNKYQVMSALRVGIKSVGKREEPGCPVVCEDAVLQYVSPDQSVKPLLGQEIRRSHCDVLEP